MDDVKLLCRSAEDLENEIKIVNEINRYINTNFGLEMCAQICLKKGRVQSKTYIRKHIWEGHQRSGPKKSM